MKKEKNGPVNKSRNSNAKLILGTLLGIIIGTLSTLFLSGYIIISIPIFITVSFVLVVFIVLLIIFVSFYKDIWIEKIFGEKLEIDNVIKDTKDLTNKITTEVTDKLLEKFPEETRVKSRKIIPRFLGYLIWARFRNWSLRFLITFFIALGGFLGSILLLNQNKLLEKQNIKLDLQNSRITQQLYLDEANRRSTLAFETGNVLNRLSEELNEQDTLSSSLIGRITALSRSLRPYFYLEIPNGFHLSDSTVKDSLDFPPLYLTKRPTSPERGQLLTALLQSNINHSSLDKIFQNGDFSSADLSDLDFSIDSENSNSIYLKNINLSNSNLRNINLSNVDLSFVNLNGADITSGNLSGTILKHTNFSQSQLSNANFDDATFLFTNFNNAILDSTSINTKRYIKNATLFGCDLRAKKLEIDWSNINLSGSYFYPKQIIKMLADFNKIELFGVLCQSGHLHSYQNNDTLDKDYLRPTKLISGSISTSNQKAYWINDTIYILEGKVFVNPGDTLIISPGTIIKGKSGMGNTGSALIVSRGAYISAEGTSEKPIIFTVETDDVNNPFDHLEFRDVDRWGGLIILGHNFFNKERGKFTEQYIEGMTIYDKNGIFGNDGLENSNQKPYSSGILKNILICFTGTNIGANNELSALTLAGVSSKTIVDGVIVYDAKDDGIEIFGGDVNLNNYFLIGCGDDAIDIDANYIGHIGNKGKIIIGNSGGRAIEGPLTLPPRIIEY